jgi:hypothetical protein
MSAKHHNVNALVSLLGEAGLDLIFQALCTERDRLKAEAEGPRGTDETVKAAELADALTELYASNLVADKCCGVLKVTHAYCEERKS